MKQLLKPFSIISLLLTVQLSASLLDFSYLAKAKEAYRDKNYTKAQELYGKVDYNEAKFNQGDSLYRQKKYKEAIEIYQTIDEPTLEAKKLHNIGNSYAQMKKIDKAISSYEEALKLKEDSDTRFNLELLQKKKEEEKKKKDKKDKDKKEQKDKNQEENKDKKNSDKKSSKDKNSSEKDKKEQEKKEQEEKKREKQKKAQMGEENQTQPPISNMEERKWQKMLNQRGVNTLMIPLNKGKKDNETNLW